jgi:hypothetical protein
MASLIYIARIKNLHEELAKSLRSAGCHVKSFKPGDITQDECLLAMTAEAVGAALHLPEGDAAQVGRTFAGTPAAPDMNEHLGSQAAVWSCIKTAVTKESQAKGEPSAESSEQPEGIELGFPHPAVGRPASTAQSRASGEIARNVVSSVIGVSSTDAPRSARNIRPTKEEFFPGIPESVKHGDRSATFFCDLPWRTTPIDERRSYPSRGLQRTICS